MGLLPPIEIESELSYAYLHAVAARAGMSCEVSGRHTDKMGVDAAISATERFANDSVLTDLTLHVQLKATVKTPHGNKGKIPYFVQGADRYDKLRTETVAVPRILVVLFLPEDNAQWLEWTEEELAMRKCAWWVSLRGAPSTENTSGKTVLFAETQYFNPEGLRGVMTRLSRLEDLTYDGE